MTAKHLPPDIAMPARPESDRKLNSDIVLRVLREQLPTLQAQRATLLGSGWATDVYAVDDRYTVRFPRNAEVAAWLDHDAAILGLVASELGQFFAAPDVVHRGTPGSHFPHGFLVCTCVPGIGADQPDAPPPDATLAAALGEVLTHIHAVPVDAAARIGLEQPEHDPYTGTLRFVHGDFSPDNIMVDPPSGRLIGVIDWGNAALGDPALDFMPLVLWQGWDFLHNVVSAYRRPMEPDFIDRVRYHAQIQSLQWLTDTIKRRADPTLHMTWLRNAFALGGGS